KTSFKLNCNCRMSIPARVVVILPKLPVPAIAKPEGSSWFRVISWPGSPKTGWFAQLKHSNRNCTYLCSLKLKFFSVEKSQVKIPGPITTLRPRFPKVSRGCNRNALTLNHWSVVGLSSFQLTPGTESGRSLFTLLLD